MKNRLFVLTTALAALFFVASLGACSNSGDAPFVPFTVTSPATTGGDSTSGGGSGGGDNGGGGTNPGGGTQPAPNAYTITYNLNGGTNAVANPATYTDGTTVTLADPERLGCTFDGWYEAEDFSGDAVTQLSGRSATLWAKWTLIEYNVTYIITNGSDDMQSASTTSGTYTVESELMSAPQKDGYSFKGWFLDAAQTQAVASFAGLTGEQTLYGHYAGTLYRVAYSGIDGATLAQDSAAAVEGFTTEDLTLALPTYEKCHYIFNGWIKEGGSQITELSASSAAAGSTLTLCAKWTEVEYAVNCTYDLLFPSGVTNANSFTTVTVSTSPQVLQDPVYTDSNFVFAGWYKDYQNGTYSNKVTAISVDDVADGQYMLTLHAKWTRTTPWTPSGATVRITSMQTVADDIAALAAEEEFYLIVTDTSITGKQFRSVNAALKANATVKFYFDLSAATTKFELENAGGPQPFSFNGCKNISGIIFPECASFSIIERAAFEDCASLKVINLPSQIKKINAYAFKNCITLETVYLSQSLAEVQSYVFNGCTKLTSTYYNSKYSDFNKIKFENNDSKPTCNGGALYVLNDSKTDWRRVYSITFNSGFYVSGYIPPQWFVESENVEFPTAENMSREGFGFDGWYDSILCRGVPITSIPSGVNDNLSLYAKWTARDDIPYKVLHYQENLNDDGYTLVDTDNMEGTTNGRTAAVAKDYAEFAAEVFAQTFIKADGTTEVNIYYKRNIITITLDLNGGTLDDKAGTITKTDKFGRDFPSISNPQKTSAIFEGWNTVGGTLPTTYNANATYTAVWTNIEAKPIQITVLPESDISVTKTQDGSVITFTAEDCDSYSWTLDDETKSSAKTCQIDTSALLKGTYTVCLEAKKGEKWRSYYAQIKVN